jgi:hypothetical protein
MTVKTFPKANFIKLINYWQEHTLGATYDSLSLIIDKSQYFKEYRNHWLYTASTRFTGSYNVAILR